MFPESGPQTSSISSTSELVLNPSSWGPITLKQKPRGQDLALSILTSCPENVPIFWSLKVLLQILYPFLFFSFLLPFAHNLQCIWQLFGHMSEDGSICMFNMGLWRLFRRRDIPRKPDESLAWEFLLFMAERGPAWPSSPKGCSAKRGEWRARQAGGRQYNVSFCPRPFR